MRPLAQFGGSRQPKWSREQITAAAIRVAKAEGLTAVSMRRVATELGAGTASLYRHVVTRDDLLDLMVDHNFDEYEPATETGQWRADVIAEVLQLLRFLRERPWLVDIVTTRPALTPRVVNVLELVLARLAPHPAPGVVKLAALRVLVGIAQTYALQDRRGGVLEPAYAAIEASFLQNVLGDGSHPYLAAALTDNAPDDDESPDDELVRVLTHVLDGLLPEQGCEGADGAQIWHGTRPTCLRCGDVATWV